MKYQAAEQMMPRRGCKEPNVYMYNLVSKE